MKGVVFVLSGFQNPARSQIRDKALEMGAKYKADWDRSCTHLVCAFINTPKYGQVVAAGGKIVTKEWVLDSYREKRLHPWVSYKLGSYNRPSTPEPDEDSEGDEADDDQGSPVARGPRLGRDAGRVTPGKRPSPSAKTATSSSPGKRARLLQDDDTGETSDVAPRRTDQEDQGGDSDFDAATDVDEEEMDTEDEIELAKQRSASAKPLRTAGGARSRQESSETQPPVGCGDDPRPPDLPELPDFFTGKSFLLYGDFPEEEKRALTRYIIGHDGDLKEDMDACVKFVITKTDWNDYFDEALCENESLVFLRPRWVNRCHEAGRRVPHQPFVVACPES